MSKCNYCKEEHGNKNTGCYNSGGYNSGHRNSGHYNSGHYNSGHRNSGHYNSGHRNSGHYNSGGYNSGYRNSGNYNSGNYNSGYYNSGWFNTNEPKMRFFNKECDMTYTEFYEKFSSIYPDLKICAWVELKDLPEKEQTASAKQMGGILKTLSYKEAWKEYWSRASASDKEWFQKLPNFDATIFEEITGIKVGEQSLSGTEVEVKIGGNTYKAIIK